MSDDREQLPLRFEELDEFDDAELIARIKEDGNKLVFDIPLGSVGYTQNPSDIAQDYLDAAFFSQVIGKHCSKLDADPVYPKNGMLLRFTFVPANVAHLIAELRRIQPWFDSENYDPDELLREEVGEFYNEVFKLKLRLPELGDAYMANFLHGDAYTENWQELDAEYPTWRWGFWRSFACTKLDLEFYTSSGAENAWIVFGGRRIAERLLMEYGGFTEPGAKLHDAALLRLTAPPPVLISPNVVLQVPMKLGKAVACWERCLASDQVRSKAPTVPLPYPEHEDAEDVDTIYDPVGWPFRYNFNWAATENGDALWCGAGNVSFIAFADRHDRLRTEAVRELAIAGERAIDLLREHSGLRHSIALDWTRLTPEQFEDLCYEIILRIGRFDESTCRKHGKTRSRDGGRDIEVRTLHRFDERPVKWIFQCKFISNGSSLSGTKVTVSDVVDQYAAGGFGVMTNEVIDSTLYDKLDAIAKNRNIEVDPWDGRKLERFVVARPALLSRFFPHV